jgi:hypothetical protein
VASVGEAEELALPADFDYLDHLRNQYRRLRGYAPALLEAFEFEAAPPAEPVLEALTVLREMNEKGKRKVPDDAPTEGVPVETPSAPERLVEAQSMVVVAQSTVETVRPRPPPAAVQRARGGDAAGRDCVPRPARLTTPQKYGHQGAKIIRRFAK